MESGRQGHRGRESQKGQGGEAVAVVAQVDDLVGVPLVAEDQRREEEEGRQHDGGAGLSCRQQDRHGGCAGRGEDADPRQDVAHRAPWGAQPFSGRRGARCSLITPGGTRTLSWPSSLTLSL